MLNIVCVNTGTKYSNEYVNILLDRITRNVDESIKFKFVCFTNKPEGLDIDIEVRPLPAELEGRGWWNKLYLFKRGLFADGDRIVLFDLKNVPVSSLDEILAYDGALACLRDFTRPDGLQNSLMAWPANSLGYLWDDYAEAGYPELEGGDQCWMERYPLHWDAWQDLFPSAFVSFKVDNCFEGIPKGAKIVFFHGEPYPDQIKEGWVPKIWKIGATSVLEFFSECNTPRNVTISNIHHSLTLKKDRLLSQKEAHTGHAVIIGGGPSINKNIEEIKLRQQHGQTIVSLNNSWEWLDKKEIPVNYHVMCDARQENENFIPKKDSVCKLYASHCHPTVTRSADCLWDCLILDIVPEFDNKHHMFWIGAGTTVGIRSIYLMYAMGFREFHIYGFDSCYVGDDGHAYEQTLNKGERVIEVTVGERKFRAAPWMVTQTHNFLETMEHLTALGCGFTIHGDGLLQYAAQIGLIPIDQKAA